MFNTDPNSLRPCKSSEEISIGFTTKKKRNIKKLAGNLLRRI